MAGSCWSARRWRRRSARCPYGAPSVSSANSAVREAIVGAVQLVGDRAEMQDTSQNDGPSSERVPRRDFVEAGSPDGRFGRVEVRRLGGQVPVQLRRPWGRSLAAAIISGMKTYRVVPPPSGSSTFSCNLRGEVWPFVTYGLTPPTNRVHLQGIFPLLDEIVVHVLSQRSLGGRFRLDDRGVTLADGGHLIARWEIPPELLCEESENWLVFLANGQR